MKTFWKQFTLPDAIKDICDWWDEVKISTLMGVWKQLTSTLIDVFEGLILYTSVEEVTANVVEIARKWKVEPKEMTKLLQSHDRLWTCKELVLVNEQKKWFLETESILMKALWRMLKVFKEFRIPQKLNEAATGFEMIDFYIERGSDVCKMLWNNTPCYKEIIQRRKH